MNPDQIAKYQEFAKDKLGFEFNNINLLVEAFTHRSYVNEHKTSAGDHNERLEFLGDAVLELVVSDFLYNNYKVPEGIMTAWRSAMVRTESNGAAGDSLGYAPLVRMSKGERKGTSRAHATIIADCYEALIGAIYVDQGYDEAKNLIYKYNTSLLPQILEEGSWRDPKSYLQELAQHNDAAIPQYRLITEIGPDHDKVYTIEVSVAGKKKGQGDGHSKQEAETAAAREGVKWYRKAGLGTGSDFEYVDKK